MSGMLGDVRDEDLALSRQPARHPLLQQRVDAMPARQRADGLLHQRLADPARVGADAQASSRSSGRGHACSAARRGRCLARLSRKPTPHETCIVT